MALSESFRGDSSPSLSTSLLFLAKQIHRRILLHSRRPCQYWLSSSNTIPFLYVDMLRCRIFQSDDLIHSNQPYTLHLPVSSHQSFPQPSLDRCLESSSTSTEILTISLHSFIHGDPPSTSSISSGSTSTSCFTCRSASGQWTPTHAGSSQNHSGASRLTE